MSKITKEKIISTAKSLVGVDCCKGACDIMKWYGGFSTAINDEACCCAGMMYLFHKAGALDMIPGGKVANCGTLAVNFYKAGKLHKPSEVKPGDLVTFSWSGATTSMYPLSTKGYKSFDHVELCIAVGSSTITCIGANNGGVECDDFQVKTRYKSNLSACCRPDYAEGVPSRADNKVDCIDVSYAQGSGIDFNKVKASGIKAVIIRAGFGNTASQKDSCFETNYKKAKAAGLKIGAYWYSYAGWNGADAYTDAGKEASACLEVLKGKALDLPVYYDLEETNNPNMMSYGKTKLTKVASVFCDAIIKGGYKAGIYSSLSWFNNYLNYAELKKKYSIWLAQWYTKNDLDCDIWQNGLGSVNGVGGDVDTNVIFNRSLLGESAKPSDNTKPTVDDKKPTVSYRVRVNGSWLSAVKNLDDFAGIRPNSGERGFAITDIAIGVDIGSIKYRVHNRGGDWLPYVTGNDISDDENGYAGNGHEIDAVEVIYYTDISKSKEYYYAKYRVSPVGATYYDWQYDNIVDGNQDGYAGDFGKAFDRLQITLVK